MTETQIKKEVRKALEKDKYLVWYPAVSRFAPKFPYCTKTASAKDIFTVFDCLALKDSELRMIQYTSIGNIRARENKIKEFYELHKVFLPAEVWGMRTDKTFKIIYI